MTPFHTLVVVKAPNGLYGVRGIASIGIQSAVTLAVSVDIDLAHGLDEAEEAAAWARDYAKALTFPVEVITH